LTVLLINRLSILVLLPLIYTESALNHPWRAHALALVAAWKLLHSFERAEVWA
jgi:hypothetical protein